MYKELIERLESATRADRELDGAIHLALNPGLVRVRCSVASYYDPHKTSALSAEKYHIAGATSTGKPYTASIDSALSLAPRGCDWAVGTTIKGDAFCNLDFNHAVYAATPALAICIAALKALERTGNGKTGGETTTQATDS